MLIDSYATEWIEHLRARAVSLLADHQLYLLVDGVFLPGLHHEIRALLPKDGVMLLFELLPGCSDAARDVSPFLIRYEVGVGRLDQLLEKCSTWPMISAIETIETLQQLAARLAPWCVVYIDEQRFNFRFPDTRRLPGIFDALTSEQQAQLSGPACRWSYMGRDGQWAELLLSGATAPSILEWPKLGPIQFGQMVGDSEADEVLLRLKDRGHEWGLTPSRCHSVVTQALLFADQSMLEESLRIDWSEACLLLAGQSGQNPSNEELAHWRIVAGLV